MENYVNFAVLKGKIITNIERSAKEIFFTTACGRGYKMYHDQDCCESVYIESIVGDLKDLLGSEILLAEESIKDASGGEDESATYTFYKLATAKGYVDIRWLGESNGYYSERVDFMQISGLPELNNSGDII